MIKLHGRRSARSVAVFLLCGAISVSGCIQTMPNIPTMSMTSGSSQTPQEKKMRQQGKVFNKTVVEGAVIGALAGALTGALIRRDATGALVGAAAGDDVVAA